MKAAVLKEVENLRRMSVTGLREKYREVFGEESRSHHKDFLFRRIAWRLQAIAEGDLTERARRRALEIANDADLRIRAPKQAGVQNASAAGRRGNCIHEHRHAPAGPNIESLRNARASIIS
jgi:hypothetical protein